MVHNSLAWLARKVLQVVEAGRSGGLGRSRRSTAS